MPSRAASPSRERSSRSRGFLPASSPGWTLDSNFKILWKNRIPFLPIVPLQLTPATSDTTESCGSIRNIGIWNNESKGGGGIRNFEYPTQVIRYQWARDLSSITAPTSEEGDVRTSWLPSSRLDYRADWTYRTAVPYYRCRFTVVTEY